MRGPPMWHLRTWRAAPLPPYGAVAAYRCGGLEVGCFACWLDGWPRMVPWLHTGVADWRLDVLPAGWMVGPAWCRGCAHVCVAAWRGACLAR
eukprot:8658-Chlamydomonas_euryale.AAC.1